LNRVASADVDFGGGNVADGETGNFSLT